MSAPKKALLTPEDGGDSLEFHYNPENVTFTKSASWSTNGTPVAAGASPEFTGTDARQLTMTGVVFDKWQQRDSDAVKIAVDQLMSWTQATKDTNEVAVPQPPVLTMTWGGAMYLRGYLKRVVAKLTLFNPDGKPLRASVDITMVELPPEVKDQPQNPTSGGVVGRRAATLYAGDSLGNIAYREYGKSNLWRALADANGIDDPMRVAPGRRLLVPTRADAQALAARPTGGDHA